MRAVKAGSVRDREARNETRKLTGLAVQISTWNEARKWASIYYGVNGIQTARRSSVLCTAKHL